MPRRDEERFITLSPDHEAQDHAATEGHGHRHLHRAARQLHGAGYRSGNRIQRRQDLLYSHAGTLLTLPTSIKLDEKGLPGPTL